MAFRDYAKLILAGGLPAVLDGGVKNTGVQGDQTRVEQTPPEPTKKDIEPFLQRRIQITENFELNMVAASVAGVAIITVAVLVLRRRLR